MTRVTMFFEPLDVLLFRDHRPFDAGVHYVARGIFPLPSVMLGCLRTALFLQQGADFHDRPHFGIASAAVRTLLGNAERPGRLHLRGPLLARWTDTGVFPYFAPPKDLSFPEKKKTGTDREAEVPYELLRPLPSRADLATTWHFGGEASQPSRWRLPLSATPPDKHPEQVYLTRTGAARLLQDSAAGVLEKGDYVAERQLYQVESRTGIAREDTGAAQDHMLYTKLAYRLAERVGFAVDVEADGPVHDMLQGLQGKVVTLGGKGIGRWCGCWKGP